MKWMLVGVITVFVVQAGFIAYTTLERESDEFVGLNGVPARPDPIANAADILFTAAPSTADVETPKVVKRINRPDAPGFVSAKTTARSYAPAPAMKKAQFVATQKPVNSTVTIEYPRAMPFAVESKNYQTASLSVSRTKKRSFFSKSFSVIKMPYRWIKSVGSKIL